MSTLSVEQATEAVYTSIQNDNEDIDLHIGNLKRALATDGKCEVEIQTERLAVNNRSGRKMMQSYFKKRGVKITFNT